MDDVHLPPFLDESIKQGGINRVVFAFIWNIAMYATLIACISNLDMDASKKIIWTDFSTSAVTSCHTILSRIAIVRSQDICNKSICASVDRFTTTKKSLIYKPVEKLYGILFQRFILDTSEDLRQISNNIINGARRFAQHTQHDSSTGRDIFFTRIYTGIIEHTIAVF